MTYTVGHVNTHNTWRAVRVMKRLRCDSIGLNEVNRLTARLLKLRAYRLLAEPGDARDPFKARSTALLVRKSMPSWGKLLLQASEKVPSSARVAPDRWIPAELLSTPEDGRIAHISIHPNAVVRGRDESVPRVREYVEYMRTLDRLIALVKAEGCEPVVTGDYNVPRREPQSFLTPYELFAKHDMAVRARGIDGIAYSRRLRQVGDLRVLSRERVGSDHPGLVLTLERRR